jgi:hypothetical protein
MYLLEGTAAYPLADALDLQAASTGMHGPVCHKGVALVKTDHIVEGIQTRVKVSIACE